MPKNPSTAPDYKNKLKLKITKGFKQKVNIDVLEYPVSSFVPYVKNKIMI